MSAFEGEAELFDHAAACFIAHCVADGYAVHTERAEGVAKQGVYCLGGITAALGEFTNPITGFALMVLPIEIMKAAPEDGLPRSAVEA